MFYLLVYAQTVICHVTEFHIKTKAKVPGILYSHTYTAIPQLKRVFVLFIVCVKKSKSG